MQKHSIVVSIKDMRCAICGKQSELQYHHIMHGTANRQIADRYGLTCWLCIDCHSNLHGGRDEYWRDKDKELMACAQRKFEDKYGHNQWFALFRKNYTFDD